ncbi:STAS-like domain-containing protein [Pseudomonas resinovorans]|uniref:STAS-like domain-containing protein n=1 Tax=Metapseudomonas resinovorans TaxID=53412 RepID=A0ABT4YAH8_METRE|nr:STAS-like domain-containing protein [Pseudomonas resinovorans]MDA8485873.1 STAS-like domain-containing protein [Pseudomonas resinovorans]
MTSIVVTKRFSEYPAGRYRADGDFSGQVFREDLLVPALAKHDLVEIDLDGAMGYGSSFLEEAFGGLVREHKFSAEQLHRKLRFKSDEEPSLIQEIWIYIDGAAA